MINELARFNILDMYTYGIINGRIPACGVYSDMLLASGIAHDMLQHKVMEMDEAELRAEQVDECREIIRIQLHNYLYCTN